MALSNGGNLRGLQPAIMMMEVGNKKRKADGTLAEPNMLEAQVVQEAPMNVGGVNVMSQVVGEVGGHYAPANGDSTKKRREGRKDPTKLVRLKRSIQSNLDSLNKGAKNIVAKTKEYWSRKPDAAGAVNDDGLDSARKVPDLMSCPLTEGERQIVEDIERQKSAMLSSLEELAKIRRKYEDSEHLMPYGKEPIFNGMFYAGRDNEIQTFTGGTQGMPFAEAAFRAEIGRQAPASSNSNRNILFRTAVPDNNDGQVVVGADVLQA